jgi:Tol biopolymer transport system component
MADRDDRLRRALRDAAPRPTLDGVRDAIARKRRTHELRRRAASGVLAVAVIAGSVGGFVGLRRSFQVADGPAGVIAFSRTVRACFDHPNVGGPQVDAFAVTPDGSTTWNLTDDARWPDDRARGEEQVTFSPDGTRFAWVDRYEGGVVVTEVLTGATDRVVDRAGARSPSWSPDGATITFTDGQSPDEIRDLIGDGEFREALQPSVYAAPATGGDPVLLAENATDAIWSPDGRTIAFLRSDTNIRREREGDSITVTTGPTRQSLWFMDADGSNERRMEVQPDGTDWSVVSGDWAPDGERFVAEVSFGDNHDIVVVNPFTRTGIRLTDDPAADTSPTWSPDGTTVAFSTGRWGMGVGHSEIATIGADGLDLRRITHDCWDDFDPEWVASDAAIVATEPWSPPPLPGLGQPGAAEAGQILYGTAVEGVDELFALDPNTGRSVNLTADLTSQGGPQWSPDHTMIASWSYDSRTRMRGIYVRPAAGGEPELLAPSAGRFDWSPDGSMIAYVQGDGRLMLIPASGGVVQDTGFTEVQDVSFAPDGRQVVLQIDFDLYVADLTTGDSTRITSGRAWDYEPAWSPDSDSIAFTHDRDVYLVTSDGTGLTNLTPGKGDDYDRSPAWSPDGAQIVFASDRASRDALRLFIMNADGSDPTPVAGPLGHGSPDPDW